VTGTGVLSAWLHWCLAGKIDCKVSSGSSAWFCLSGARVGNLNQPAVFGLCELIDPYCYQAYNPSLLLVVCQSVVSSFPLARACFTKLLLSSLFALHSQLKSDLGSSGDEGSDVNGGPVTYVDDTAGSSGAWIVQWNNMKA
jgi:hypothetical protein